MYIVRSRLHAATRSWFPVYQIGLCFYSPTGESLYPKRFLDGENQELNVRLLQSTILEMFLPYWLAEMHSIKEGRRPTKSTSISLYFIESKLSSWVAEKMREMNSFFPSLSNGAKKHGGKELSPPYFAIQRLKLLFIYPLTSDRRNWSDHFLFDLLQLHNISVLLEVWIRTQLPADLLLDFWPTSNCKSVWQKIKLLNTLGIYSWSAHSLNMNIEQVNFCQTD